jgi:hypothetical protein
VAYLGSVHNCTVFLISDPNLGVSCRQGSSFVNSCSHFYAPGDQQQIMKHHTACLELAKDNPQHELQNRIRKVPISVPQRDYRDLKSFLRGEL